MDNFVYSSTGNLLNSLTSFLLILTRWKRLLFVLNFLSCLSYLSYVFFDWRFSEHHSIVSNDNVFWKYENYFCSVRKFVYWPLAFWNLEIVITKNLIDRVNKSCIINNKNLIYIFNDKVQVHQNKSTQKIFKSDQSIKYFVRLILSSAPSNLSPFIVYNFHTYSDNNATKYNKYWYMRLFPVQFTFNLSNSRKIMCVNCYITKKVRICDVY